MMNGDNLEPGLSHSGEAGFGVAASGEGRANPPATGAGSPGSAEIELRASNLARELRALHPRARAAIGAVDEVLVVLDAIVMAAQLFLDEDDTRPWDEKFGA